MLESIVNVCLKKRFYSLFIDLNSINDSISEEVKSQ